MGKMRFSFLVVLFAVISVAFAKIETGGRLVARPTTRETYMPAEQGDSGRRSYGRQQLMVGKQQPKSVGKWNGPACILGGAIAHLTLGTLYCWGNFLSYAPANLRFFDGLEHIGKQPDALYVIPFAIIAQAIAMPFGPSLVKAIGASRTLLLGSWLTAAAVYLASYQKTLSSFILFYSLLFGAGAGLAYTAPMAAGWKWMPNSKGLVSGGVLAGFGAGGFLFSLIGSGHVNPDGLNPIDGSFPPAVYARFPSMLRKLALMYAVLSFVGSLFLSEPPAVLAVNEVPTAAIAGLYYDDNEPFLEGPLSRLPPQVQVQLRRALNRVPDLVDKLPLPAVQFLTEKVRLPCLTQRHLRATQQAQSNTAHLHQQELSGRSSGSSGVYAARGLTVAQALRTRQFWLLWLMAAACATAGLNTAVVYKQFASTSAALTGDEYQALVGGIGALLNGLGRVSWGGLSDRIGFKAAFAVLSVLQAAAMLTYTTSAQSKGLFALNTCSLFFTLGGTFALFPPAVQRMFGPDAGAVIYGLLYSAFAVASVFGGVLTKRLTHTLGWEGVFQTMAAMSLLATGLATMVKPIEGFAGSVV